MPRKAASPQVMMCDVGGSFLVSNLKNAGLK
jgi:hypothetical protein